MATVWIALIPSFLTMLTVVGGWLYTRKKDNAESESVTVGTALNLVETLREEMDSLRQRVSHLEAQQKADRQLIDHLSTGTEALRGQVEELGHHPVWPFPSAIDDYE